MIRIELMLNWFCRPASKPTLSIVSLNVKAEIWGNDPHAQRHTLLSREVPGHPGLDFHKCKWQDSNLSGYAGLQSADLTKLTITCKMYFGWNSNPHFTGLKPVASTIWATEAYGTDGETRTHNIWFLRPAPLPVGLHPQIKKASCFATKQEA